MSSSIKDWVENKFSGSGTTTEGFVGGMSGGGVSPGFLAICFALMCPCIYQLINCTGYKGGWADVFYVMLVGVVATVLGSINPVFTIISPIAIYGLWIYSSINGVDDFLCPISAPGGLRKKKGGGRKMRGGKSKKMSGKRKY